MASSLSVEIKEENAIKTIKTVYELSPLSLLWILDKGCSKTDESQTWFEYLSKEKKMSNTKIQKTFGKTQVNELKAHCDCSHFDTTLMYHLIKVACDDIDDNKFFESNTDEIEYWIQRVKEVRNETCHSASFTLMIDRYGDGKILQESINNFNNIFLRCGAKYSVDQSEIDSKLNFLKKYSDDITKLPLTVKGNENFVIDCCADELKLRYKKESSINPLYFAHNEFGSIYVSDLYVNLEVQKSSFMRKGQLIKDKEILNLFNSLQNQNNINGLPFILVKGPAGAGKSTLVRKIMSEWVDGENEISGIGNFELLLYIECRERDVKTLWDYFRRLMPGLFKQANFDLNNFLSLIKCRKTLILVDGLDEINDNTDVLIKSIVEEFKFTSASILFTTRPESEPYFEAIKPPNINITTLTLHGIPSELEETFVKKYYDQILKQANEPLDLGRNPDKLLKILQSAPFDVQQHLKLPLNKALAVYLYIYSEEEFKLETTSALFKDLAKLNEKKMVNRLQSRSDLRLLGNFKIKDKVKNFLDKLESVAFCCITNDEINLDDETYMDIRDFCKSEDLPPDEVISTFLTYKKPLLANENPVISFPHKGLQEYLAAEHILKRLKELRCKITDIFRSVLNKNQAQSKLKRFLRSIGKSIGLDSIIHKSHKYDNQENESEVPENIIKYRNVIQILVGLIERNKNEKGNEGLMELYSQEAVQLYFPTDDVDIRDTATLLLECKYNNVLAKHVANKVNSKIWLVNDSLINTAYALLHHKAPETVLITINEKLSLSTNMKNLLVKVSTHSCNVALHNYKSYDGSSALSDDHLITIISNKT